MLYRDVVGSSLSPDEHPASSSPERTVDVPDPYRYTLFLSFGSTTSVCVCEPRQVCTAATCLGLLMSDISKILTPRNRSFCGAGRVGFFSSPAGGGGPGGNPCTPQSRRPFGISTDINIKFLYTDTSPCPPGQTIEVTNWALAGLEMS